MNTDLIYQAELRRLFQAINMKSSNAHEKSIQDEQMLNLFYLGQSIAYQDMLDMLKNTFEQDIKRDDWD